MTRGIVKDSRSGEPLPFATVYSSDNQGALSGTGTIAGASGEYSLEASADYLTATYLGYKRATRPMSPLVDFSLLPESTTLPAVEIVAQAPKKALNWQGILVISGVVIAAVILARYLRKH